MDKPKFSILTSSYNNARYLDMYVKSILWQDYRPLEVVFVDDGNSDNTFNIIKSYEDSLALKNIDLTVIQNKSRLHCGSAYLKAYEAAKGDFFGILDSDDALARGSVKAVMDKYLAKEDCAWIYTQFEFWNSSLKKRLRKGFCKKPKPGKSLLFMGEQGVHGYSHWRTFSRRVPHADTVFGKGLKSAVDKYMGYRLEELAVGGFLNRVCYFYRTDVKHSISKSGGTRVSWRDVMKEAKSRRKKNRLKPYEILAL